MYIANHMKMHWGKYSTYMVAMPILLKYPHMWYIGKYVSM
jgi:hypothetical protein